MFGVSVMLVVILGNVNNQLIVNRDITNQETTDGELQTLLDVPQLAKTPFMLNSGEPYRDQLTLEAAKLVGDFAVKYQSKSSDKFRKGSQVVQGLTRKTTIPRFVNHNEVFPRGVPKKNEEIFDFTDSRFLNPPPENRQNYPLEASNIFKVEDISIEPSVKTSVEEELRTAKLVNDVRNLPKVNRINITDYHSPNRLPVITPRPFISQSYSTVRSLNRAHSVITNHVISTTPDPYIQYSTSAPYSFHSTQSPKYNWSLTHPKYISSLYSPTTRNTLSHIKANHKNRFGEQRLRKTLRSQQKSSKKTNYFKNISKRPSGSDNMKYFYDIRSFVHTE